MLSPRLLSGTAAWPVAALPVAAALIVAFMLSASVASTAAGQTVAADTALADSARVDSLLADSPASADSLLILSDSTRRALDSVAVAALEDTVAVPPREVLRGQPVFLRGRKIFDVFSGLGSYDTAERADRLSTRITTLAASDVDVEALQVLDGLSLTTVRAGDMIIMSVTDDDALGRGTGRHEAAVSYAKIIREEVNRIRERSTLRSVLISVGISILLFILLIFILKGVGRFFRWADNRVQVVGRARVRGVRVGQVEVLSRDRIMRAGRTATQIFRIAVYLFVVYVFLTTVFGLFPWTQSWSRLLLGYLIAPVRGLGGAVVAGAPDLLAIIVIILIVRWLIQGSNFIFAQLATGNITLPGFYAEFAEPTRKIVRFLLIVLGVMLVYPYTPIADSKVFQGLTIFLGVLFSLGSSTAIANIVAGVVLTYTRAFRIGDRIKVAETVGDVVEKTFLITRVRTPKNEDVAIPNSTMLSAQITNYSTMALVGDGLVIHTSVTIGYDIPWPKVQDLLIEAAKRTTDVEPLPAPFVLQTALGDFSVVYQINAYTRAPERMPRILSDLHRHIQDTFAEAKVEILSPVYEARRDGNPSTIPPANG